MASYTNLGLCAHCEKALREKWYYLWGTYGQRATQKLIDDKISRYPDNARWRSYVSAAIGRTRVSDCYGLVKSYLWWQGDGLDPKYNAAQDMNTSAAYNRGRKRGPLSALPETPGAILYMTGHVGVYMGGGRFIECAGGGVGMSEGRIEAGKVVKGSRFTDWFLDGNIEYQAAGAPAASPSAPVTPKEDAEMVTEMKLSVNNGPVVRIPSILKDGSNYPNLRALVEALNKGMNLGIVVGWDEKAGVVRLIK